MNNNNTVVLTTLLNGEQAKRELDEVRVRAQTLSRTIDDLRKNGNHALAKTLEPDLKAARKSMAELRKQTIDVNHVLANLHTAKPKELKDALSAMNKQLDSGKIKRGSKEWNDLNANIRRVRGELNKISTESQVSESRMSRLANGFNKYFAGFMTLVGSITGVSLALRKVSEDTAKMDDTYSDVMKTTGMTREQVVSLNEDFKKMDTRTAREELNMLARDAGKLGISLQEDVMGFVEAGNIINVALGEDLGEGAIQNIGKITEVFRLSTKELDNLDLKGRMLAVGSAINELGQSSTANEAYLVNFTQRLGGVASQAGISVQNILGYASALDQSGQAVEMSATALQNFIMKLMGDPVKFAQIAGIEVEKFNKLLQTDTNEAIKTVLKSLSEKGGFQQLIPVFQEMGLDGARAVGVLSALATNIDKVDEAQRISNKGFSEGNSVINEYNVKNNNLMAQLEKRKKQFKDAALELGERLNPALLKSTNILTYLIKILPGVLDFLTKYGPALVKVTALILAYNLGIKAQVTWKRLAIVDTAKLIVMYGKESAQMSILALRYVFASKSTAELSRSLKALWATTKLNPVGLILTVVTALGYGLYKWSQRNDRLLTQANAMVEINKEVAKSIGSERAELDMLLGIARNEKISKDERIKAINRLNEISPEYLGNLNLENINTDAARISVEKYTTALMENARQKAIGDKMSELYSKRMELEMKISEENRKIEVDKEKGLWQSNAALRLAYQVRMNHFEREMQSVDRQIAVYQKFGETLVENKKTTQQVYAERWRQLEHEKQVLEDLEKQHADLYNQQQKQPSGVLRDDPNWGQNTANTFADEQQLRLLTQRIEGQRAIVAEKEKELEATRQLIKTEQDSKTVTPLSPLGETESGGKSEDPMKKREEALKSALAREQLSLKQALLEKRISEEEYHRDSYLAEANHLIKLIELQKEFKKDTTEAETQLTDKMLAESNRRYSELQKTQKEHLDRLKGQEREQPVEEDWSPQGFADEKGLLDLKHQYGIISEEEYQEELYELREKYLDKYLEKEIAVANAIGNISQNLSGAINGFQQAEEMSVERKYDKMIKAAGNNSKKVQQLEEEKERELHAIRAKYADKQFIITVANVIASTAVSAMESFKAMAGIPVVGPALGAAAAAAAVLYGAGQIAIAKQQRDAAKEGYAGGGYTRPGNWWEEDGPVHKGEFVGNRFAVANPAVRKVFDVVDQAQRTNTIGSLTERDFQTALNYNEFTQRKVIGDALANFQPTVQENDSFSEFAAVLVRAAEINEKLSRRLDEPIVAETYIEGKGGSKEANDLYNRMKKNISRG